MKGLKKLLCVILAVVMMMGLCIVGVSADTTAAVTVTISTDIEDLKLNGASDSAVSFTLKLYPSDNKGVVADGAEAITATFSVDGYPTATSTVYKASAVTIDDAVTYVVVEVEDITLGTDVAAKVDKDDLVIPAKSAAVAVSADIAATIKIEPDTTDNSIKKIEGQSQSGSADMEGYLDPGIIRVTLPTSVDIDFQIDPQGLAASLFDAQSNAKYRGKDVKEVSGTVLFKNDVKAAAAVYATVKSFSIKVTDAERETATATSSKDDLTVVLSATSQLTGDITYRAADDKKADGETAYGTAGWYDAEDNALTVGASDDLNITPVSGVTLAPASGDKIVVNPYVAPVTDGTAYLGHSDALTVKNSGYSDLSIKVTAKVAGDSKAATGAGKVLMATKSDFSGTGEASAAAIYMELVDKLDSPTIQKPLVTGTDGVSATTTLKAADADKFTTAYNTTTKKYTKTLTLDASATETTFYLTGVANSKGDWSDVTEDNSPTVTLTWDVSAASASTAPTAETDAMEGNKAVTITYTLGNKTKVTGLYYYTISSGEILSTSPGNLLNVTGYTNTASGDGGTITTTAGAGTRLAVNEKGTTGLMLKFDDDAEKDYLKVTLNYK